MSDIKLISKDFVEGSAFINGPALGTKQDKLTADNAGDNITITGSGSSLKINSTASGGSKWIGDKQEYAFSSLLLGRDSTGAFVNSIFVFGPMYDKDGKEIGGTSGSRWISDDERSNALCLGKGSGGQVVNSIFVCGPLYAYDNKSIFVAGPMVFNAGAFDKDGNEIKPAARYAIDMMNGGMDYLWLGTDQKKKVCGIWLTAQNYSGDSYKTVSLDMAKLEKLDNLLNNADSLLALLNN